MEVYILAVTHAAYGDYCIAGVTEHGEWVRPIPSEDGKRFWEKSQLTYGNNEFLKAGDVIEFKGKTPTRFQFPNHTEDTIVLSNFTLVRSLSNNELIDFLETVYASEEEFLDTIKANGRSLCLIKIDNFRYHTSQFENRPRKPKMNLNNEEFNVNNPLTNRRDYIVKDCKWSSLILNDNVPDLNHTDVYISIGLATPSPHNNVEYPQIIGVHTNPAVPVPVAYPF